MSDYNCSNCLESVIGSYNSSSRSYSSVQTYSNNESSGIDYLVAAEPIQHNQRDFSDYTNVKNEVYQDAYNPTRRVSETYSHSMDSFLNPQRTKTVFIGQANEVKEFVEDAFFKLTERPFPDDIQIKIVSEKQMKKLHPGNVLGFALNRKHQGLISEIFIKNDMLDRLMLTIGHELGHVLTRRLSDNKDEEAKAFAFSLAWMKTIKENNIANLSTAIKLDAPAKNGLHDVALDYVLKLIERGRGAFGIYLDLIRKNIKVGDVA